MTEKIFRVWDEENRKFDYFHIGQVLSDRIAIYNKYCINGCKFEQYTGLKDRNGKEIYDGDILTLSYGIPPEQDIVKVVWLNGYYRDMDDEEISCCGWFFKNIKPKGCSAPAGIEYQDDIEIIGNIYENQELLQEV